MVLSDPSVGVAGARPGGSALSARAWAVQQFAQVDLGDQRRNRRVVEMAAKMAAHPDASLPQQMADWNGVRGAYGVLNNPRVSLDDLLAPTYQQTLAAAGQEPLVLLVEDTTELDYTAHPHTTGLGPIGDGKGRGLLLHSTLAVTPDTRALLGLAHAQVVVRTPKAPTPPHWSRSAEAQVWEVSAHRVGAPPSGVIWIHVSDRESDVFEYLAACVDQGKDFLVRAYHNRRVQLDPTPPEVAPPIVHLLDYARHVPAHPDAGYWIEVPAEGHHPARTAKVELAWSVVRVPAPSQGPTDLRGHAPVSVWLLRVWEPQPPAATTPVEWILLSSRPISTLREAYRSVAYYTCRWLCEDYHQCLKTGCRIEDSQLDDGADLTRLLGFAAPLAVRLLQLRHAARTSPDVPATSVVDPLLVAVLARRQHLDPATLTLAHFWQRVARLGGYLARRSDGPPGWRTLWKGWRYLSDLTEGARLLLPEHPI